MRGPRRRHTATHRHAIATLAVLALLLTAGCLGSTPARPNTQATTTTTTTATTTHTTAPPTLDDRLATLAAADDPEAYASAHDIPYEDGRVQVVLELRANATLPEEPRTEVTQRHDALVEAWVAVDDLAALAGADGVQYVRPPITPDAVGTTEGEA